MTVERSILFNENLAYFASKIGDYSISKARARRELAKLNTEELRKLSVERMNKNQAK